MQLTLFGIGVILLMLTWTRMAKPTYLDDARDKLFDLRDLEVREFFLRQKDGLNHPTYIQLRKLINGHLRHTERMSFVGFVCMLVTMSKDAKTAKAHAAQHDAMFHTDNPEISKFSKEIRTKAVHIMLGYMIENSLSARAVLLILMAAMTLKVAWQFIARGFSFDPQRVARSTVTAVAIASMAASLAVPRVGPNVALNALEERAFSA